MDKFLVRLLLLSTMAILIACLSAEGEKRKSKRRHQVVLTDDNEGQQQLERVEDILEYPSEKQSRRNKRSRKVMANREAPTMPSPQLASQPEATSICLSCADRRNKKDYYSNPDDCHTFYQCFFHNETFATGILQQCPRGTFWNDEVIQCLPEGDIPCADLCRDDAVAAAGCHGSPDNCAQFFICSHGASYPFCCPPETRFEQVTCSCIPDPACTDKCSQPSPLEPTVVAPAVNNGTFCVDSYGVTIAGVPGSPSQFITFDLSDPANPIPHTMNCAPSTLFDLTTCRCDTESEVPLQAPPPSHQCVLWMPFNSDNDDHSIERFVTFLIGEGNLDTSVSATGTGGSFMFNGGWLEIPGLKSFDFQKAASWCLFFRCETGQNGNPYSCTTSSGILSNNNDASMAKSSIIMATQPSNTFTGRVSFRAPIGTKTLSAPLATTNNGWNQACIVYNGADLRLYLNGALVDTQLASGNVAIGSCPYAIGTDQAFGDFRGHIDDVLVCPFALTQEEIGAHYQGDTNLLTSHGLIPA